jgi:hypothetical protein
MTVSRVVKAGRIVKERAITDGGVGVALGVAKKRQYSSGCVFETCGLVEKRCRAYGCVLRSLTRTLVSDVEKERPCADGGVVAAVALARRVRSS